MRLLRVCVFLLTLIIASSSLDAQPPRLRPQWPGLADPFVSAALERPASHKSWVVGGAIGAGAGVAFVGVMSAVLCDGDSGGRAECHSPRHYVIAALAGFVIGALVGGGGDAVPAPP
jgi:hypothetical protein